MGLYLVIVIFFMRGKKLASISEKFKKKIQNKQLLYPHLSDSIISFKDTKPDRKKKWHCVSFLQLFL